jgi:penicillin-binding protein 2
MQGVMERGTGRGAQVPGITVCGKTGTVENYAVIKGELVKQPNHSFFAAFAPRENPRIAIMCVVENSGRFGGTYAAPITSLMIEKYLNDTIDAKRIPLQERMENTNLIPPLMMQEMRRMDSLKKSREEEAELKKELKYIRDTLQSEDNPTTDEIRTDKNKKTPSDTPIKKPFTPDMILPDNKKGRADSARK